MQEIRGSMYDYPVYYELAYGTDWRAEFDFLESCFERYTGRTVRRLFEPACGTGRLIWQFSRVGYEVAGLDLNRKAVAYCNERFERAGLAAPAIVGDMSDFRLPRKYDAAFNTISSVRHLPSEQAARGHLQCMADCLAKGGLYMLGLHLTPRRPCYGDEEQWSSRRGNLGVLVRLVSRDIDLKGRNELVDATFDIYTPRRQFRIVEEMNFRTYTWPQMQRLLASEPRFEVVATHDFHYDIDDPIDIDEDSEDVVFVLRRR
ncbi:MAG: class I SAM-dependent methyltransferase [Pirellulales bacterium]|nr:class I SAM-dependent methyltransferase [Planctomycetales bacterium]